MEQIKYKYIVWYFPEVWPEGTNPCWILSKQTDNITEAFISKLAAEKEGGQAMITQKIEVEVRMVDK